MNSEHRRVIVIGTSGCGKSTFAKALAASQGSRYVELDDLFWAEGWTPKPQHQFIALARGAARGERWVMDGNYSVARETIWPRATHIVWLNFSRSTVLLRVLRRTVWRVISRQPLWHGNRETLGKSFFSRQSILVWAASTYDKNRHRYAQLRADKQYAHLAWTELRHPREAKAYLRQQAQGGG
ncbi:toxin [Rhodoferax sp.]|uniref:toxin n=1 Tax=Rhodoferax sp. TaxID=50421 RepID=UPI0027606521|nr:toxin [Rhodoferax sp.]